MVSVALVQYVAVDPVPASPEVIIVNNKGGENSGQPSTGLSGTKINS